MKRISINISIKWKIFIFLLGFCSALLVLLWLFQVVFLESFYKNIKIKEINSSAAAIIKNIENEDLPELIERIAVANDVCVEVVLENGMELFSSGILRDSIIQKMPPFEKAVLFKKTQEKGGELLEYYRHSDIYQERVYEENKFIGRIPPPGVERQETIIYAKVITNDSGRSVMLLLNSVISPVNATVTTLRTQLYYVTGFMIVFSAFLAFVIAKRVSQPIERINESAKMLASGNYETEFHGDGYKEISELSETLNYTAKELSKVEGLRQELIANISHDLRTPLTLIGGYAEAMRDFPNENNAENAQIIVDETRRLTTLVNDVLDISKLQAGAQGLHLRDYNLTESIKATIKRMNGMLRKDGYVIEFLYDREIYITADETKISQAFYNLLINAINYTGKDKSVFVRQTADSGKVKIEVIDSGEGIAKEDLPYIWDRYYKLDKTHKRAVTGTGLGLSIVKSIIDLHEGEYGVSSEINQGSVFWFSLSL